MPININATALQPVSFYVATFTADEDSGGTDFLAALWTRSDADRIVLVTVGIFPTASAGVYRSDGQIIASAIDGSPFAAGGGIIILYSLQDVRNFRIRANVGGTIPFTVQAYRSQMVARS